MPITYWTLAESSLVKTTVLGRALTVLKKPTNTTFHWRFLTCPVHTGLAEPFALLALWRWEQVWRPPRLEPMGPGPLFRGEAMRAPSTLDRGGAGAGVLACVFPRVCAASLGVLCVGL